MKDYLKEAKFDVQIVINNKENIDEKKLSYGAALALCEHILEKYPDDDTLQNYIDPNSNSFGFVGYSGNGYKLSVSAGLEIVDTLEEHNCPQRVSGPWAYDNGPDTWKLIGKDKCCSYCGSLHPDRVIELIKEHGTSIIELSTKSYKLYINQPNVPNASFGGIKYYRHHDTKEFVDQINELYIKAKQK